MWSISPQIVHLDIKGSIEAHGEMTLVGLVEIRRKDCLKMEVAKESERTITPFVELGSDFISCRPT